MTPIRLLLVDDQELIRESLSIVLDLDPELEVAGLAANGEEALALCGQLQPQVVLMDIRMPVMDGITATREIKQRWPHARVLILTTFQEVDHVIDALSAGAEGYLLKAIHPTDLIAGIKLIHRGGTLLPHDLAKLLVQQVKQPAKEEKAASRYGLSEREVQVLECLALGLNNKQIAERLFLSEGTVKNYISGIYHKLDVKDRMQAAYKARNEDLV
ncbi:response regulator [Ectobacillus ponti]|uniref:Response regulator transcription factor n=1 Tax=Ectobacillus ponti TaxID=2961894 RepID=A0AA41X6E3_9BACI|nr:response regulator transcription factor [Ectobacillus ponti]MCP8969547.1 response regulator transcription factor [Ectobacillus ponti]